MRPTWAEISLENLAFNYQSLKNFIGRETKIMAIVKADGYGHGAVECARKLEAEDVDWFGVALPEEAVELRQHGITKPILCLGSIWRGQENLLFEYDLTPVVFRLETVETLNSIAKSRNQKLDIHVKVDTGMNRLGVRFDEIREFAERLKLFPNLNLDGLMTHFASADSDTDFTNTQIEKFNQAVAIFEEKGFRPTFKDLANSPAALAHPNSRGNLVRLGGVLYGLTWDVLPKDFYAPELRPVMALRTEICLLKRVPKGETLGYSRTFTTQRDSLIATIPIGYNDGYPRNLSGKANVIVNGYFAPIVGRISMDLTLVDVTDIPQVQLNEEVVLFGSRNGLTIKAEELAELGGTISYEITCGISKRVPRKFREIGCA